MVNIKEIRERAEFVNWIRFLTNGSIPDDLIKQVERVEQTQNPDGTIELKLTFKCKVGDRRDWRMRVGGAKL